MKFDKALETAMENLKKLPPEEQIEALLSCGIIVEKSTAKPTADSDVQSSDSSDKQNSNRSA